MKQWYTLAEIATLLHVSVRTAVRLVDPYRDRGYCHLARNGKHPRLVLWVPVAIVRQICEARQVVWRAAS